MNVQYVSVHKLKPHPRNKEFFKRMQGEEWERFVQDIKENGIRDPLKVTKDGTIIGGEQRWLASQEIGLEEVPVVYQDLSPHEALHLLLMDNLNRRHLTPIEKAKIASILKEEWNVKSGNNEHNNESGKGVEDIAEVIGESKRTTQRLMKLNDLIPELKELVDNGRLGQTSGETLAHLSEEEQHALYEAMGDSLLQKTVQETKELRKAVELERPEGDNDESQEEVQLRISSTLEKQRLEFERQLAEERERTDMAMTMVSRLEAELEAKDSASGFSEREEELEKQLSNLNRQLVDAEERARMSEIQKEEMLATGSDGYSADTLQLGMWKQVTVMVKQMTKEYTHSEEIKKEIETVVKVLENYINRLERE